MHAPSKCYRQNEHMRGKQQLSPKLVQNMQIKPPFFVSTVGQGKWLACSYIDILLLGIEMASVLIEL